MNSVPRILHRLRAIAAESVHRYQWDAGHAAGVVDAIKVVEDQVAESVTPANEPSAEGACLKAVEADPALSQGRDKGNGVHRVDEEGPNPDSANGPVESAVRQRAPKRRFASQLKEEEAKKANKLMVPCFNLLRLRAKWMNVYEIAEALNDEHGPELKFDKVQLLQVLQKGVRNGHLMRCQNAFQAAPLRKPD